LNKIFQTF